MIRRIFFIFFPLAILLFSAGLVNAQVAPTSDVTASIIPSNPGPNQNITISLRSYTVTLQTADISWSIDGGTSVHGIGKIRNTVRTKDLGVPTHVEIIINPVDGDSVTKNITITPMSVDLLWEATDSTVPPLYRGKALPTSESHMKFVAIPQVKSSSGALLGTDNFLYSWSEEYIKSQLYSGFAENSFPVTMSVINPIKHVSVSVSNRDGSAATSAEIQINPLAPHVTWYAASPLYGTLFDHALSGTYKVVADETSLVAMPYFFSPGDPTANSLQYSWKLNNQTIKTPSIPNALVLVRDNKQTGTATIDLSVNNITRFAQGATNNLTLLLQ